MERQSKIINQVRELEGHLVLLVLMPGYRQGRIGQLSYEGGSWVLSNLYNDQAPSLQIPLERVVKISQVQTWDVYDAIVYIKAR